MKRFLLLILTFAACSKAPSELGRFSARPPVTISGLRTVSGAAPVNLSGRLIEKCPVAGCWFYLQDDSGRIKVDTKNAGFVVVDVPLGTRVEVSGRLGQEGSEPTISAEGIRF